MQQEEKTRVTKYCIPGVTLTPHDDYWQIRKIGLTAERVKKDPAFGRTRKLAREFAATLNLAQKISAVLASGIGIKKVTSRLTGILIKVVHSDTTGIVGCRNFLQGNWQSLEGFECNPLAPWKEAVSFPHRCRYNSEQGEVTVYLPAYKPVTSIHPPSGITHYRIKLIVISVDATGQVEQSEGSKTSLLPWKAILIPQAVLTCKVNTRKEQLHMAIIGIQWYMPAKKGSGLIRNNGSTPATITAMCKGSEISILFVTC